MNGLTMLDCVGPMLLDEVEQPMFDIVGSTTLGDVTLTNKVILGDLKRVQYWPKKCWIMLDQHCRLTPVTLDQKCWVMLEQQCWMMKLLL